MKGKADLPLRLARDLDVDGAAGGDALVVHFKDGRITPLLDQPYRTFTQGVRPPSKAAKTLRRAYLLSSERPHYLAAAERARQQGFEVQHIAGAGHDVLVTQPHELVTALLALV